VRGGVGDKEGEALASRVGSRHFMLSNPYRQVFKTVRSMI
jgi:hypothetical protein